MKYRKLDFLIVLFIAVVWVSCDSKQEKKTESKLNKSSLEIKYSKGYDIQSFKNYYKLIIKSPYPDAKETFEYIIESPNLESDVDWKIPSVKAPVQKLVVTSTTHIPMLELLGVENTLVGFQNTKYVSSEKTRKRIDEGLIKDLGKEFALNTEVLFDLDPDVVIGFAMTKTN